jgi:voltage-gated potassium channel Kch
MHKVPFGDRVRYAVDNAFARGTGALIGLLAVASAALIVGIALLVKLTGVGPEDTSLPQLVWMALMRTLDSGTMGGDQGSWGFLFAMLAVTIGGIFVVSALIGVLTTGIEARIEALRKGRSRVIERDHTVILGWSAQIFPIIAELVVANQSRRGACIVVLGEKDKVEMEDEIRERAGATGRTRIVCRTGSPIELADLQIASLHTARSIIVLAPDGEQGDASVIKTLLAITNAADRRPEPYHIVAEIRDPKNMEVAKLVGGDEVELVLVGDLIARIIAQTCRQSGLSAVYTELLDFGGDEIYFRAEPALAGQTFGDALLAYEDSAVIGLRPAGGKPQLNPPPDTRIAAGDQLIVIAADDDTIRLATHAAPPIQATALRPAAATVPTPERTLILGWNWRAPAIITELDAYVAPGSRVMVVADAPDAEAEIARCCAGLRHETVTFQAGDTTDRRTLDGLNLPAFDHIIILCYSDTLDAQQADARTLVTLLHLRDIANRCGHCFSIVSEMLDIRNRNLAEVTQADDFIVSDRLVSLMLSQVSEDKALNAVFADLFDPQGAEIYLKPATDYVAEGAAVNFYTVVEAARRRGEVAFGYRLQAAAGDKARSYGVVVNPDKSAPITFAPADRVIVLAEG